MKTATKIILCLPAFISLIVDQNIFSSYTSGKALFVQTLLLLAGLLILINFFCSKEYREEITDKTVKCIKHPLVISVLAFVFLNIISTIFAVDKYLAFWGEISRAEGLAGLMFFFAFLVFGLFTFEKKDWLWFFKLSLFTALILLGKEFTEFLQGASRPGSYTGNPTFLAGYLLFSISTALIILNEVRDWFFKYLAIITLVSSILGIFIAQTRGTLLGLGLGVIAILIYFSIKGKDINYKIFNLRKISIGLLCLGIVFSGVFVLTRKNEVWQKVPGLSRLAVTNTGIDGDISTPVRFFVYRASLEGVNPIQNGWKKLLIGWGPDNFIMVDSKYYDPELYKYETVWHDRAHNKFLDVLVMNGIFGLLAYLAIWFNFFATLRRNREDRLVSMALLFFGASYLTHLMFVFDQISTSIPFFGILSFAVYLTARDQVETTKKAQAGCESKGRGEILVGTFLVILTIFIGFVYFKNTLPGYVQMRDYSGQISNNKIASLESQIDSVFTPFTSAQANIRLDFLKITNSLYNKNPNELNGRLLEKAIMRAEEYIAARPQDFQFMTTLADLYSRKGNLLKSVEYLKRGEKLLRTVLIFSPNRPDINWRLALNLLYQERFVESFAQCEKIFAANPLVVPQDKDNFEVIYTRLAQYFYEQKDQESFIKVANRLKENNYEDSASLDKIIDYLEKNGVWPNVAFE